MSFTLKEIAEKLGCPFTGDGSKVLTGIAAIQTCEHDQITFVESDKWLKKLPSSGVGAIVTRNDPGIPGLNVLLHDAPQFAFVQIISIFDPPRQHFDGISSKADIAETATIATPTSVRPFASIGAGSTIGPNTVIEHGARIGVDVVLGERCHIHANAVIADGCVLGDRVTIHSSTVIGADGFGYIQHEGEHVKIPQIGKVKIGNDVEIGANTCVDRGAIGDTVIGNGVKIDNLVQIAHNVVIGDYAIIISQVGISGSSSVGARAILAGKVGMKEHVHVGADAIVAAQSVVTKNIKPGAMVAGHPAGDMETWRKYKVIQRNLPKHWSTILSMISEYKKK